MKPDFWKSLPPGFTVLAPMEDVTDTVFRRILVTVARPGVFFKEFTNVDGICALSSITDANKNGLMQRLCFSEEERPVVAQIWGIDPDNFFRAAKVISDLGFDGVDINMGCPQRRITKTGGGAALIGKSELVKEIIEATKKGAEGLPVSVKTRLGGKTIMTEKWLGFLLGLGLAAISVHGRTAVQMSKGEADWKEIGKVVKLRDAVNTGPSQKTLIIGNGDVKDWQEAQEKHRQFGVDGVMIGRGVFANPAAFDTKGRTLTPGERLRLLSRHTQLFGEVWQGNKDFSVMKKFVKMYISGWNGAAGMRKRMMLTKSFSDLQQVVEEESRGMG